MKKVVFVLLLVLLVLLAVACLPTQLPGTTGTQPSTTITTAPPPSSSAAPVLTGWQQIDGERFYYNASGEPVLGWQQIDGHRYYFGTDGAMMTHWQELDGKRYYLGADGRMVTGWLELEEGRYYLDADGVMRTGWLELEAARYYLGGDGILCTGWQEVDGLRRYFRPEGQLAVGWAELEDGRYYFDEEGCASIGWIDVEDARYYMDENGILYTGWLEQNGTRYYLKEDGVMARGEVEIEGVKTYFTSTGAYILLVNPWNFLPEGFEADLVYMDRNYCSFDAQVDRACHDALMRMLKDCEKQCYKPMVVSAYRTHAFQEQNYQRKVNYYLNLGYGREEAERLAAAVVAVPGTSEHQSGLAVDIVDNRNWSLDDSQANTPVQKWLMEHCWEYGFILRYPKDKTDVTGIIYEPWHYRYVGVELAAELRECGLTLEEYLAALTQE